MKIQMLIRLTWMGSLLQAQFLWNMEIEFCLETTNSTSYVFLQMS